MAAADSTHVTSAYQDQPEQFGALVCTIRISVKRYFEIFSLNDDFVKTCPFKIKCAEGIKLYINIITLVQ
jgi:hypothetical protein